MAGITQKVSNKGPKRGALPSTESTTGAQYEVLRTSHIHGRVVNAGEVVAYDGVPGKFLRPLNAEAEKAKKAAAEIRASARDTVVRTEEFNGARESQRKLRELDNQRRGLQVGADGVAYEPSNKPEISAADRKELQKQAEHTREQELERSQEAGGVLLQMTGTTPETVIPTTGPGAVANAEQLKAAEAKKDEAGGKKSK